MTEEQKKQALMAAAKAEGFDTVEYYVTLGDVDIYEFSNSNEHHVGKWGLPSLFCFDEDDVVFEIENFHYISEAIALKRNRDV